MADADRSQYLSEPVQVALSVQDALLACWPQPQTIAALLERLTAAAERDGQQAPKRDQVYRALRNLEEREHAEEVSGGWMIGDRVTAAAERIRRQTAQLLHRYLPQD